VIGIANAFVPIVGRQPREGVNMQERTSLWLHNVEAILKASRSSLDRVV
jgi:hypothetical protein